jgi:DNA-binding response OmpR family regulator
MKNTITKILMVEDDVNLRYLVKENLESKGFEVVLCENGEEGIKIFLNQKFNFCILDIMMPLKDGFTLAKEIRLVDERIPIIFLTAKAMEKDKIEGFNIGGDDYMTKPFSMKELVVRINAILKRVNIDKGQEIAVDKIYQIGQFTFDFINRTLETNGSFKNLSAKESELLKVLVDNKNTIVDRKIVLIKVWGDDDFFLSKSMDVYITRLRKMLNADTNISIQNIYGIGYKLLIKS